MGRARQLRAHFEKTLRSRHHAECVELARQAGIHFDDQTDKEAVSRQFWRVAELLGPVGLQRPQSIEDAPAQLELSRHRLESALAQFNVI